MPKPTTKNKSIHHISTDVSPKLEDCLDKTDIINKIDGFINELCHTPNKQTMDWVESEIKQWHILTLNTGDSHAWISNGATVRKTTYRRSTAERIFILIKSLGVWKSEFTENTDLKITTRCTVPLEIEITDDGDIDNKLTLQNTRWAIALYRIRQLLEEQTSPSAIFTHSNAIRNSNVLKGWAMSHETEPTENLRQNIYVENLFDIINDAQFTSVPVNQ